MMKFPTEWEVIKLYKIVPKHQPGMLGILNFMLLNDIEFISMFDDSPSVLHQTRWASMSERQLGCRSHKSGVFLASLSQLPPPRKFEKKKKKKPSTNLKKSIQ